MLKDADSAEIGSSLKDQIYAIIDSKIQYIAFKTNGILSPETPAQSSTTASMPKAVPVPPNQDSDDQVLTQIEQYSHTIKLLLLLRSYLQKENTHTIFELLSENKFLEYNENALERLLNR